MTKVVKISIILVWAGLFLLLLKRDYFVTTLDLRETRIIKQARQESFLGVYFRGQRIGYVKNRLVPADSDTFTLYQNAFLRLNILNEIHPVSMRLKAGLNRNFRLEFFAFQLSSPFYKMTAHGKVKGKTVSFSFNTGKDTITDSVHLARPPFISTNQRGYLLRQKLRSGEKIKIPYFDPVTMTGKDTVLEYGGLEKTLIKGRIYRLHHFIETFSGIRINSWLDEQGKVIKEESPAGFVFLAEPEFQATDLPGAGSEILSAVSAPLKGAMPDLSKLKTIRYHIITSDASLFDLDGGRQALNGKMLTVSLEQFPTRKVTGCPDLPDDLAATPYIQSDNLLIRTQALAITKKVTTVPEKIRALARWVYDNLEKRPVLGIPDAVTTLKDKRGDCNEHAVLFAALARSIKVPARIAAGIMYNNGAFYYHAWNEVCLDGNWLSLDTTRDQIPADLGHIRFVHGGTGEMIRIGALLGNLAVTVGKQETDVSE